MIVGCYTLELYCDVCWDPRTCPYEQWSAFPHQYTGPNRTKATQQAKLAGWIVRHGTGDHEDRAVCPDCKREGKR